MPSPDGATTRPTAPVFWPELRATIEETWEAQALPGFIRDMARYALETGGKRVRPELVLAAHEQFGGDRRPFVHLAAAIELIHNASLVHDDFQDGDETRRGAPAVWTAYPWQQSVNLGTLMFTAPFDVIQASQLEAGAKVALLGFARRCVASLIEGQMREFEARAVGAWDEETWLGITRGKTGALFALCLRGGAMLGGASPRDLEALEAAGVTLGRLFQLRDDIIDVLGAKESRDVGGDIREGKPTLLIATLFERDDDEASRERIRDILALPRDETEDPLVAEVLARFDALGCVDTARARYAAMSTEVRAASVFTRFPVLGAQVTRLLKRLAPALDTAR